MWHRVVAPRRLVVAKPGPVARLHQVEKRRAAPAHVHVIELHERVSLVCCAISWVYEDVVSTAARLQRGACFPHCGVTLANARSLYVL